MDQWNGTVETNPGHLGRGPVVLWPKEVVFRPGCCLPDARALLTRLSFVQIKKFRGFLARTRFSATCWFFSTRILRVYLNIEFKFC